MKILISISVELEDDEPQELDDESTDDNGTLKSKFHQHGNDAGWSALKRERDYQRIKP